MVLSELVNYQEQSPKSSSSMNKKSSRIIILKSSNFIKIKYFRPFNDKMKFKFKSIILMLFMLINNVTSIQHHRSSAFTKRDMSSSSNTDNLRMFYHF